MFLSELAAVRSAARDEWVGRPRAQPTVGAEVAGGRMSQPGRSETAMMHRYEFWAPDWVGSPRRMTDSDPGGLVVGVSPVVIGWAATLEAAVRQAVDARLAALKDGRVIDSGVGCPSPEERGHVMVAVVAAWTILESSTAAFEIRDDVRDRAQQVVCPSVSKLPCIGVVEHRAENRNHNAEPLQASDNHQACGWRHRAHGHRCRTGGGQLRVLLEGA